MANPEHLAQRQVEKWEGEACPRTPGSRLHRMGAGSAEIRNPGGECDQSAARRRRGAGETTAGEVVGSEQMCRRYAARLNFPPRPGLACTPTRAKSARVGGPAIRPFTRDAASC